MFNIQKTSSVYEDRHSLSCMTFSFQLQHVFQKPRLEQRSPFCVVSVSVDIYVTRRRRLGGVVGLWLKCLFGFSAFANLNNSTHIGSHRQSSGAFLGGGNWTSKLPAAIRIRLYGAALKSDITSRKRNAIVKH
ncbi:hypothetical protein TNCV_3033431 [Trichonephila clavipes]|nr:hypothetical protein TNCV_3033431 [Trichonephila clavipes]